MGQKTSTNIGTEADLALKEIHRMFARDLRGLETLSADELTEDFLTMLNDQMSNTTSSAALELALEQLGKAAAEASTKIDDMFRNLASKLSYLNHRYPQRTTTLGDTVDTLQKRYRELIRWCKDQAICAALYAEMFEGTFVSFLFDDRIEIQARRNQLQEWQAEAACFDKKAEDIVREIAALIDEFGKLEGQFKAWSEQFNTHEPSTMRKTQVDERKTKLEVKHIVEQINPYILYRAAGGASLDSTGIDTESLLPLTGRVGLILAAAIVLGSLLASELPSMVEGWLNWRQFVTDRADAQELGGSCAKMFKQCATVHLAVWKNVGTDLQKIEYNLSAGERLAPYKKYMRHALKKTPSHYKLISTYLGAYGDNVDAGSLVDDRM
ncbi:hypothetical protein BDZ91DRAFT_734787 [Kalaharituber pfeilii]|nr:hypothetical protein BDZ91DRAFT_734787 [Kalaharituber pfeilii]